MTRRLHQIALLLIATSWVSMASPTDALAQGPTVIDLCYVQGAGIVYRIDPSGSLPGRLPEACKSPDKHFQFTLTDGAGADHGSLTGLADDDHPEYVREGEAAAGDLGGTYPNPTVVGLQDNAVAATAPSEGQVLTWDDATSQWAPVTPPMGVTDHGALTGLADDDHPEYVREGEAAGGDLTGTYPNPAIAADAVTAAEIATGAVGSPEIVDGSVGGADVDPNQVQRRVTGSCAAGESIRVIAANGTVTCETDDTGGGVTDHGALTGLGNDDHTQYVLANGVRSTTNGFAVTGTLGTGGIPTSGAGVRLMWYPGKAAFRVGEDPGTRWNDANIGQHSTAMGLGTTASGANSTAMGRNTTASGDNSTTMGNGTTASGLSSTAMGSGSVARGFISTAMGNGTSASGDNSTTMGFATRATARASTAMGNETTASGAFSTAMGSSASTDGRIGSFVYGDASTNSTVNVLADNSFVVRAQRVFFGRSGNQVATTGRYIETSTGAYLSDGGTWTNSSSRSLKENFREVDLEELLETAAGLRVHTWNYRAEDPSVRHLGPTAEAFRAAFGLGDGEEHIATVDIGGVNLAAIQALERRTRDLRDQLEAKDQEVARLRADIDALLQRLERVEGRRSR